MVSAYIAPDSQQTATKLLQEGEEESSVRFICIEPSFCECASDGTWPVYDLLANRRTVKIAAHDDDVNSCCWADTASGNVLVSASDDTYLKVW